MNDNRNIEINPVSAGLVIVQILFMIFMVVSFNNLLTEERIDLGTEVVEIEKNSDGLSEKTTTMIKNVIYNMVSENSISNSIGKIKVEVRDGSVVNNYYDQFDIHYLNFIADIPEVKQSYQVFYEWSDNELNNYISPDNSITAVCLDEKQLVYGKFDCVDSGEERQYEINNMLYRYNYRLPEREDIYILPRNVRDENSDDTTVDIKYLECGEQCDCRAVNESEKNVAVNMFGEFVESLGFRLDDIKYSFDNCDGD